ncbi:MAG TPA: FkbM family methyltransferase, partial [Sphingobacteriaceae bacterium]
DTLIQLKKYIDPEKNILEIGAHCGTSSIVYASFIRGGSKCYVFEPQKKMFELLELNIKQNNLQARVEYFNKGIFCYTGQGNMNDVDLDGGGGNIERRLNEESHLPCNFGGVTMGRHGERIELTTVDRLSIDKIGFIHCDAQGSESFIFSNAVETIKKHRPVIFFENNKKYYRYLYESVCAHYPEYRTESEFDVTAFCLNELGYSDHIDRFNDSINTLLIP